MTDPHSPAPAAHPGRAFLVYSSLRLALLAVAANKIAVKSGEAVAKSPSKKTLTRVVKQVAEAEKYAEEDKATRERIEARNGLENYAFSLKNQVNDAEGLGGKISDEEKETVSTRATVDNYEHC